MIRRLRDRGVPTGRVRTPRTIRPRVEQAEARVLLSGLSNPVVGPQLDGGTVQAQQATADLAVSIATSPSNLLLAGENAVYVVTVTNRGPDTATDVVLVNTLPAGVTFLGATFGTFDPVTNTVTVNVGDLPADDLATPGVNEGEFRLGIVIQPTDPGTLVNTAAATTTATDPVPTDNTATATAQVIVAPGTPVVVAAPAPRIIGVARVGARPAPVQYHIQFDRPMEATVVRRPGNYLLELIRPDIPFGSRRFVPIPIASITYAPTTATLVIVPGRRIGLQDSIQLTVNGDLGGLVSAEGIQLDGNNDGRPGGLFTTIFRGFQTRAPRPIPPAPAPRAGFHPPGF